jgi:hypothetical protein
MTREQAIAAAPSSRSNYWGAFLVCSIGFVGFAMRELTSLFSLRKHASSSWLSTLIFEALLALVAVQAGERLFYPVRAAQRTLSMEPVAQRWVQLLESKFVSLLFGTMLLPVLALFVGVQIRFSFLWLFGWLAHQVVSDVLGRDPAAAPTRRNEPTNQFLLTNIEPLHSQHWGEGRQYESVT